MKLSMPDISKAWMSTYKHDACVDPLGPLGVPSDAGMGLVGVHVVLHTFTK